MKSGNDQRRIHKSEYGAKNYLCRSCNPRVDDGRDGRTDLPANGSQYKVRRHDRQYQAAERNHDHGHHLGRNPAEKFFQIDQHERRQNRRQHLRLVSDHIYFKISKVPYWYVCRRCSRHCIGIQELTGYQRQTENDPQHLRSAHFLCNGPADSHRQHMKYRFSDEP